MARSTEPDRDALESLEFRDHSRPHGPQEEFSLPPVDGGKDAWLALAASFIAEALVWGFPFSYGIFQDYYSTHAPFKSHSSGIAIVGTAAMGIMYLGSPIIFMAFQRWPNRRRQSCGVGLALMAVALMASSFAQTVWQLILTQGVLYAVAGTMLYYPVILFLDEWFVRRKGLVFGIVWAGAGAGGVVIPFIMSWGLQRFTFRTMLRAWAVTIVLLTGPLLIFAKPRLPVTLSSTNLSRQRFDFWFALTPQFLYLQLGNILQSLGFFIPSLYLPTYARSLKMSSGVASATVALVNASTVFGCIFVGAMIDRMHVTTVTLIAAAGSAFSVLILWGVSVNAPLLVIFCIAYGFFAGSFTTTYTGVIHEVRSKDPGAEVGLIFGLLVAGRGIGSVVSGPLSEALLNDKPWEGEAALGYGSGYGAVIVFTGLCVALSGSSWVAKVLGKM